MNKVVYIFLKYLPFIASFAAISMLVMHFTNSETWNEGANGAANRGAMISIVSAIFLNIVGALFAKLGIEKKYIVFNYGFVLGPVIGFLLDQLFGTEHGYIKNLKGKNYDEWLKDGFGAFCTSSFMRYIITVMIDMFISAPLMNITNIYLVDEIQALKFDKDQIAKFMYQNMPSALQSIVGVLTFNIYTNDTRFKWAYQYNPKTTDKETLYKGFNIIMFTSISAMIFGINNLPNADPIMDRIPYILFTIILTTMLNQINSTAKDEKDNPVKLIEPQAVKDRKSIYEFLLGVIIFSLFVAYGIGIPLMSKRNAKKMK